MYIQITTDTTSQFVELEFVCIDCENKIDDILAHSNTPDVTLNAGDLRELPTDYCKVCGRRTCYGGQFGIVYEKGKIQ